MDLISYLFSSLYKKLHIGYILFESEKENTILPRLPLVISNHSYFENNKPEIRFESCQKYCYPIEVALSWGGGRSPDNGKVLGALKGIIAAHTGVGRYIGFIC